MHLADSFSNRSPEHEGRATFPAEGEAHEEDLHNDNECTAIAPPTLRDSISEVIKVLLGDYSKPAQEKLV